MPLIAAGIGAVANTGLSWLSGKKAKKQSKKATKAQAQQSAANSALAKVVYGDTKGMYAPSVYQGQLAGNTLMALMGLGGGGTPAGGAAPGTSALAAYQPPDAQAQLDYLMSGSSDVIGPKRRKKIMQHGGTPEEKLRYALSLAKSGERGQYDAWMMEKEPSIFEEYGLGENGLGTAQDPQAAAQSALDSFKDSINYGFLYDEGQRGVETAFGGQHDSGAAGRALVDYGTNMAHSTAIGPYMQMLAQQQGVGQNAISGVANAGQNMYGAVSGQGQLATDARMNQYGVGAQAFGNTMGALGKGIGQVASAGFDPTGYAASQQKYPMYGAAPTSYNQGPIINSGSSPAYGGGPAWSPNQVVYYPPYINNYGGP